MTAMRSYEIPLIHYVISYVLYFKHTAGNTACCNYNTWYYKHDIYVAIVIFGIINIIFMLQW
jgi:hypothetical protein